MLAKKCDRCGKLYELYDGIEVSDNYRANAIKLIHIGHGMKVEMLCHQRDLCPDCMRELIEWMKAGGKNE